MVLISLELKGLRGEFVNTHSGAHMMYRGGLLLRVKHSLWAQPILSSEILGSQKVTLVG